MTYRLFVPTDGSDCARRALSHAIDFGLRIGDCTLHLAHAHEEPLLYGEIAVYVPRDKIERLQREASEAVLAQAEPALNASGLPWRKEILVGPVAETLAARARELGCDAIVMGTRGATALGNLLLGSVATRVVHLASMPVTLVK